MLSNKQSTQMTHTVIVFSQIWYKSDVFRICIKLQPIFTYFLASIQKLLTSYGTISVHCKMLPGQVIHDKLYVETVWKRYVFYMYPWPWLGSQTNNFTVLLGQITPQQWEQALAATTLHSVGSCCMVSRAKPHQLARFKHSKHYFKCKTQCKNVARSQKLNSKWNIIFNFHLKVGEAFTMDCWSDIIVEDAVAAV